MSQEEERKRGKKKGTRNTERPESRGERGWGWGEKARSRQEGQRDYDIREQF